MLDRKSPERNSWDWWKSEIVWTGGRPPQHKTEETLEAEKLPVEVLAAEWLSQLETRPDLLSFLGGNLLPALVLGVEKLLKEVSSRNLIDCMEAQDDFNPINFLAQCLMRSNPLHSSLNLSHPYCKSMKQVSMELSPLAAAPDDQKLEELRQQSRLRCKTREQLVSGKVSEEVMGVKQLGIAYTKWFIPGETSSPFTDVRSLSICLCVCVCLYVYTICLAKRWSYLFETWHEHRF